MLLQILVHTPTWVFAVFAVLLWLGLRQLRDHTIGLRRMTVLPLAMVALSVYGVESAFGNLPTALIGWAGAALVSALLVLQRALPAGLRYDAPSRSFAVPGNAVPLLLLMGIFFTKYVVGAQFAMHPELALRHDVVLGVSVLYGVFSGIFAGRALRLLRLASRSGERATAAAS